MYFEIIGSILIRLMVMNLILIIDMWNLQLSPLILEIYSLVHELRKICNLVTGM